MLYYMFTDLERRYLSRKGGTVENTTINEVEYSVAFALVRRRRQTMRETYR